MNFISFFLSFTLLSFVSSQVVAEKLPEKESARLVLEVFDFEDTVNLPLSFSGSVTGVHIQDRVGSLRIESKLEGLSLLMENQLKASQVITDNGSVFLKSEFFEEAGMIRERPLEDQIALANMHMNYVVKALAQRDQLKGLTVQYIEDTQKASVVEIESNNGAIIEPIYEAELGLFFVNAFEAEKVLTDEEAIMIRDFDETRRLLIERKGRVILQDFVSVLSGKKL